MTLNQHWFKVLCLLVRPTIPLHQWTRNLADCNSRESVLHFTYTCLVAWSRPSGFHNLATVVCIYTSLSNSCVRFQVRSSRLKYNTEVSGSVMYRDVMHSDSDKWIEGRQPWRILVNGIKCILVNGISPRFAFEQHLRRVQLHHAGTHTFFNIIFCHKRKCVPRRWPSIKTTVQNYYPVYYHYINHYNSRPKSSARSPLLCKAKRQYLPTFQVSIYILEQKCSRHIPRKHSADYIGKRHLVNNYTVVIRNRLCCSA